MYSIKNNLYWKNLVVVTFLQEYRFCSWIIIKCIAWNCQKSISTLLTSINSINGPHHFCSICWYRLADTVFRNISSSITMCFFAIQMRIALFASIYFITNPNQSLSKLICNNLWLIAFAMIHMFGRKPRFLQCTEKLYQKLAFHFIEYRNDHIKRWTFPWIFVHTNSNKLSKMRWNSWRYTNT